MTDEASPQLPPSPRIDPTVSHSARIWDYWLGGKDHYPADRKVGDQIAAVLPDIPRQAREDRQFLRRVVEYLVGVGVRQFLDIGTGLPSADNTHEVAQRLDPACRIVYVDNDPLVLVHAQALLTSTPEGSTDYIEADLHDPVTIVRAAAQTLDLDRPVAVTMLGIVWHLVDDSAYDLVGEIMDAMPPGSYLALNHPTIEVTGQKMAHGIDMWNEYGTPPGIWRTPDQIERFFDGMELIPPGVVSCPLWHPDPLDPDAPQPVDQYGAVGRKR